MSLRHFRKPEIKEEGLCQKNLRADLKKLQMTKDGTICISIKIILKKGNCNTLNHIKYLNSLVHDDS